MEVHMVDIKVLEINPKINDIAPLGLRASRAGDNIKILKLLCFIQKIFCPHTHFLKMCVCGK
jgi:hypothetical protein